MTKTLSACLAGLVGVLLIGFPHAVSAADNTPWRTMHAGANPFSFPAARQQCLNAGVSTGECDAFAAKLAAGTCERETVPDGTVYRWLGSANGTIYRNKPKQLGGSTAAWRCLLPSGRTIDWYAEDITGPSGCNNAGEPILQSRPVEPAARLQQRVIPQPPQIITSAPIVIDECCCEDDIVLPGSTTVIPINPTVEFFGSGQRMN